jgi:hypothetical protein
LFLKIIILPVALYGYRTWSLTLKEEHRLKVSGSRLFSAEENIWTEEVGENEKIMRSFITCTVRQIIIRIFKKRKMGWTGNVPRMGRRGIHTGFWWESQKERDH